MRKIIDGKTYDTETALRISGWSYGQYGDFNRCEETLFKTRKGAWFIYGEGGARSQYGQSVGQNSMSGGHKLFLVTEEEAKAFVEKHGDPETYFENFGEPEEG
jgi:hypothetical protein